ncbi:Leucine-rich repeat receptor protein kinase EMS1 [Vitis vinifera]|uniref:Leucine-rich repeat receptor protein kinase EMS1 n=1 Tax=Vitis vinifera TaxID=29760 RepID=A0A438KFP6_VITVI|nr:Leucine-rich repeat receptor protein kinase EMS1 [Vitis vinifera]
MFSSLTKLTYLNLSNAIRTPLQPKLQTHFPKMLVPYLVTSILIMFLPQFRLIAGASQSLAKKIECANLHGSIFTLLNCKNSIYNLQNFLSSISSFGYQFSHGKIIGFHQPDSETFNGTIDVEDGRQEFFHGIVFLGLCNRILGTFEVLSLINCIENHQMLDNMLARVSWAALLNFKSSLADHSNRWSSWQGQNCCSRLGIRCSDLLHAIAVDLRNPNPDSFILNINSQLVSTSDSKTSTAVQGTISPSLFSLHHLRYLDLSFNDFMFSKLPTGFSNLTRLTYLSLENAMFSDSITTQFANLTSLRWLDLSCSLKIVDEPQVASPLQLWSFWHGSSKPVSTSSPFSENDFNSLASAIPKELANLTALSVLDLSSANLHGSIPFLPQLQELYVGNNLDIAINLSSMFAVPWTHLERLDIQSTQVIGSIPASFTNTTSLVQFTARNCGIQGHLSQLFQNLNSLQLVSLMENSLDGPIPDSICKISSLQCLLLAFNSLTGRLADFISQLTNFIQISGLTLKVDQSPFLPIFHPQFLELSSCDIGGGIPDFLSNLTQLAFLSLANNSLSGTIPSWLFNLPKLNYLDLAWDIKFSQEQSSRAYSSGV